MNENSITLESLEFGSDIEKYGSYQYTQENVYSARRASTRLVKAVSRRLQMYPHLRRIVDLGCGDGYFTHRLNQLYPAIEFIGIDPCEKAIARAQALYPKIQFQVGNIYDPPSFPKDADLVTVIGVLHHLEDAEKAVRCVAQVGYNHMMIVEHNGNNPLRYLVNRFSAYARAHGEGAFTPWTLKKWIKAQQFHRIEIDYFQYIPFICPTPLTKVALALQPVLERIPVFNHIMSGLVLLDCRK